MNIVLDNTVEETSSHEKVDIGMVVCSSTSTAVFDLIVSCLAIMLRFVVLVAMASVLPVYCKYTGDPRQQCCIHGGVRTSVTHSEWASKCSMHSI